MSTVVMRLLAAVAAALVLVLAAPAAAADPAAPPRAMSDAEVTRRLAFIDTRLRVGAVAANRWWNVCYYGWTALTAGQFVVAIAATDRGLRTDMAVGAAASSLGVIPLGIFGFPARTAAADLSVLPETTPADRRRKLAHAERLLQASAAAEAFGRSWMSHALSAGVSIGVGLVLGLGYKRPVSGVLNALGGIALSEVQILTQPTDAIDDFEQYSRWSRGGGTPGQKAPKTVNLMLAPAAGGLGLAGWF